MPRGQGYETPLRRFRVDDPLWDTFGDAVKAAHGKDRSDVLRQLMAWFARMPDAKLPERPPAGYADQ